MRGAYVIGLAALVAGVLLWSRRSDAGVIEELGVKGGAFQVPARWAPMLARTEKRHLLPKNLLARVAWQESRFRDDVITGSVRSSAGALGMFQFMPATAAEFNVDPLDPEAAADAAARYLVQLYRRFGDWRHALAAYNWGQGNLARRDLHDGIFGDDLPEETKRYVAEISADVGLA